VEVLGPINERTSARYTATLTDETGAAIDGTALDAATLTLYDAATGTVINSRSAQDVKNTNGVTISAAGELVWVLAPADNAILGVAALETHVAFFLFTWGGAGSKACPHEVAIQVRNLAKHPAV